MSVELKILEFEEDDKHITLKFLGDEIAFLIKRDGKIIHMSIDTSDWPAVKAFINQQLSEFPHE